MDCNGNAYQPSPASFTATVADAALSATGVAVSAAPGQPFSGTVARLTDANPDGVASDDTATISWGDGATSTGTVVAATGGGFDVTGSHTYAAAGSYTISVAVSSSGGSHTSASSTATVQAPTSTVPVVQAPTVPAPVVQPPVVQAKIAISSAPAAGELSLDASGSAPPGTTAGHYDWTLGSAPGQDIVCPGNEPYLQLHVRAAVSTAVTLQTVDAATGAPSSATQQVSIPAPGARGAGGKGVALFGVCSGATTPPVPKLVSANLPSSARPPVNAGGAPPSQCNQDLVFGAADLRGCFNQIPDPTDLPGGISIDLASLLCAANRKQFCLEAGGLVATANSLASLASASITLPKPAQVTAVKNLLKAVIFPSYYSYSAVRLDGVDIVPQNGYPILVIPSADAIVAPEVKVFLDHHVIEPVTIPIALYIPAPGGSLGTLTLPHQLPLIGSLPFSGSLSIALARAHTTLSNGDTCEYACAALTLNADLPDVFSDNDGDQITGQAVVTADAVTGLQLDTIEVSVPSADIGGLGVKDVDIKYDHSTDSLYAKATVELLEAAGDISGSLTIVHGAFQGATVDWDAGDGPGIDLGGPFNIYLVHLGGGISLNPTTISANGKITGGPQVLGCSLFSMSGTITTQYGPFSLDANAQGQLLCQNVADEYFHVDQGGSILVGGDVNIGLLFFQFSGGIQIAGDTAQGHIQADANMNACVDLAGTHCVGAEVVLSDKGVGLCADLGFTHAGGGIIFPDDVIVMFDSCDIAQFRTLPMPNFASAGTRAFSIPKGQAVSVIGVKGSNAAPRVTLIGPGGQKIDTPADGYVKTAREFIVADDAHSHETYFLIDHMPPGEWKMELDPGSVPITAIQQSSSLPSPDVHARLTRLSGHRLALHYTLHPLAGQRVSFVERDSRGNTYTIGSAHGSAGTLDFTPAATLGLRRTIVAEVAQDGHPREDDTLLHYRAPSPTPLPAPRGLRARRAGDSLRVSWRRVQGASAYAVVARLSDHTTRFTQVGSTSATLTWFPAGVGATVEVRALRDSAIRPRGLFAQAKVKANKRLRTVHVTPG